MGNTITESGLVLLARAGAVEALHPVQRPRENGYRIYVTVKNHPEPQLLVTSTKKPRLWRNFDRLLAHVERHYGTVHDITVSLEGPTNDKGNGTVETG